MAIVVCTGLYIGNFAELDTDESNFTNEGVLPSATIDNNTLQLVEISQDDANDDGRIGSDDSGRTAETFTYDLGAGSQTSPLDSEARYSCDVLLGDGSTVTIVGIIYQLDNGDTFIISSVSFDNLDIQSVTIGAELDDFFYGKTAPHSVDNSSIVCYVAGTLIETEGGEVPVETLRIGDRVWTADNGFQEIRWIGSRTLNRSEISSNVKLRPIKISAGTLSNDTPAIDLFVSRQHRILIRSNICERMFGDSELLVPAIRLTEIDGIDIVDEVDSITYWHFMFDEHQIVRANGALSESMYFGPNAIRGLTQLARDEIHALFPELSVLDENPAGARQLLSSNKRTKNLVWRHIKNRRPVVDEAKLPVKH